MQLTASESRACQFLMERAAFTNPRPKTNEIVGLQVLKFLCALMVIQIHAYSFIGGLALPLCRIAVPVFFMISGFFMCDDSGVVRPEKLKRSFIKILKLTAWAALVYLCWLAFDMGVLNGQFDEFLAKYIFSIKPWLATVFICPSGAWSLWYLIAFLQVLVIVWLGVKLNCLKLLYWSIPICLAANLLLGKYSPAIGLGAYKIPLFIHRNSITIGLPCVMLGMLLRQNRSAIPDLRKALILTLSIGFLLYAEAALLHFTVFGHTSGDIGIFTVPLAVAVFMLFYRLNTGTRIESVCATLGREHSLNIYIWHVMALLIILRLMTAAGVENPKRWPYMAFAVAAATIALSFVLRYCSARIRRLTSPSRNATLLKDTSPQS